MERRLRLSELYQHRNTRCAQELVERLAPQLYPCRSQQEVAIRGTKQDRQSYEHYNAQNVWQFSTILFNNISMINTALHARELNLLLLLVAAQRLRLLHWVNWQVGVTMLICSRRKICLSSLFCLLGLRGACIRGLSRGDLCFDHGRVDIFLKTMKMILLSLRIYNSLYQYV